MGSFGETLRELRTADGLTQQGLVDLLGGAVARSTLANLEKGRQNPSEYFLDAVARQRPTWSEPLRRALEPEDEPGDEWSLAGPYALERVTYVYCFREAAVPEEIISVRQLRALRDGADGYGLMQSFDGEVFEIETEALWGGHVVQQEQRTAAGRLLHLERFQFPVRLRRGQTHEFAVRSWVNHSDDDNAITLQFSRPVERAQLNLNFYGERRPQTVWSFGPVPDPAFLPRTPRRDSVLEGSAEGACQVVFTHPEPGRVYGAAWQW